MKILKRILLALILVPVLLMGSLVLYVHFNQSEIVRSEIAKLNKEHQGRITVGESELSLYGDFPYVSIRVDDVRLFETKEEGAPVILDVKDIYVGFNVGDFMNGNYDIRSIVIEEGFFNIVIHENNTTNLQNALAGTGISETETPPLRIHLKKIELRDLDIHTLDEATNTDVEKFIYKGRGGFSLKDNTIAGHIDTDFELNVIKDGDTTFIHEKHFEVHTDLEYNDETGIIDIQPSGIVMENGDFELEGSIDTKNDVYLDFYMRGTKPNLDMLIAFAPIDIIPVLDKYQNAGEIYFNARVEGPANKGNTPFFRARFGAEKAFLENTERKKKIDNMGFNGTFTNGENRDASTTEHGRV